MKKDKTVLYVIISLIVLILVTLLIAFSSRFTEFYKDCTRVRVGMNKEEVVSMFSRYINNANKFEVSYNGALWGEGIYISKGGDSCNIKIRNNEVEDVDINFEP